jgi:hypothetical protein
MVALVSKRNPTGTITNSDLEMAGVLLHEVVLESHLGNNMTAAHLVIGCNNSPAVSWTTQMASRSATPIAYRLFRGLTMRQQVTSSALPSVYHVAGINNVLANVTSRPAHGVASHFHLMERLPQTMCPKTFLTIFNSAYPLPQKQPWRSVQPNFGLWSSIAFNAAWASIESGTVDGEA